MKNLIAALVAGLFAVSAFAGSHMAAPAPVLTPGATAAADAPKAKKTKKAKKSKKSKTTAAAMK